MSKWLERAKQEFIKNAGPATAIAAEGNPTTVTAAPAAAEALPADLPIGSNGSSIPTRGEESFSERVRDASSVQNCLVKLTLVQTGHQALVTEESQVISGYPVQANQQHADTVQAFVNAVMTVAEETRIRAWLAHIEETDPVIIAHVLERARVDPEVRKYLTQQAGQVAAPQPVLDDRRRCTDCSNLTPHGRCVAARRGAVLASRTNKPVAGAAPALRGLRAKSKRY